MANKRVQRIPAVAESYFSSVTVGVGRSTFPSILKIDSLDPCNCSTFRAIGDVIRGRPWFTTDNVGSTFYTVQKVFFPCHHPV